MQQRFFEPAAVRPLQPTLLSRSQLSHAYIYIAVHYYMLGNQAAKMGTSLQRSQDKVPARHFTTPRPVDQWYAGGQMRYTRTRVESTSC